MNTKSEPSLHSVNEEIIEYLITKEETLLAKLYVPFGSGPFPAVVSIHGGAWTTNDRNTNEVLDRKIASSGVVVAALDFRLAPKYSYPSSIADINFGIRWLKRNAEKFKTLPNWIGAIGTSSGGHQVLLNLINFDEPTFTSISLDELNQIDAQLAFVVACWPISNPYARYQMVVAKNNERLITAHNDFFKTEEAMQKANPQYIVEKSEHLRASPLLIIQGTKDDNVTPTMANDFTIAYKSKGGKVSLQLYENESHQFIIKDPNSPASILATQEIINFILDRGKSIN